MRDLEKRSMNCCSIKLTIYGSIVQELHSDSFQTQQKTRLIIQINGRSATVAIKTVVNHFHSITNMNWPADLFIHDFFPHLFAKESLSHAGSMVCMQFHSGPTC